MGRAKRRRKSLQKKKRLEKIKKGINVPFDLANAPKKLRGISNRHVLKTNIHNLVFVQASFENIKYSSSNITNCNFRDARFKNIDFIGTNLKGSKFKNAKLTNVIFYNANLKSVNFENVTFKNVYFINCKLDKVKNLHFSNEVHILNSNFEDVFVSENIKKEILNLVQTNKFKKHFVWTTKTSGGTKINKAILKIMLENFTEDQIIRTLKVIKNNRTRKDSRLYFTFGKYYVFFFKYLKIDDTI